MGKPFVNRVGERYGRLEVIEYVGVSAKTGKYRLWKCKCDCSNEVIVSYRELAKGDTRSCGCLFKEVLRQKQRGITKSVGESALNQLYYSYQRNARTRKYSFDLTKEQFRELTQSNCYYCGLPPSQETHIQPLTNGGYTYTGIDRINNDMGYTIGNVRPCCKFCNSAKGVLSEQEFYAWVLRVLTRIGE